ncbi:chondroitinase-B domain-containing protein [Polaribacter sp.]|uniref:chondroitinase-B domain-containing protein n=1 Tax=Polaribacter sp. TaxID=1920175 RepID=UPI003EF8017C
MKKNYVFYPANSKYVFILFLLSSFTLMSQMYTSDSTLRDDVNAATNGGTFIVANGTYDDFSATFENMATEENPIIVRAETVGGVTLTGGASFVFRKSSYITLEGFIFDGEDKSSIIKLEGSNNIRISRNVFNLQTDEDSTAKWVYIGGYWDDTSYPFTWPSHHNRIDHNIFQNKSRPGHYITVDGNTDEDTDIAYQSQYDRIDHNYFKNNSPRAVNEQESIRVGWSEMSKSSGYTTVEFNLFEDCDGDPEIVSVKSSDNIVRHNTFLKSYGTLSLRHGDRNRVEGNYFFGGDKAIGTSPDNATLYTGGIRIYGKDHVIINNYMQGLNGTKWDAPITLTLGDVTETSSSLSSHFRANNVLIAYNTLVDNSHGIEIGYSNNDKYDKDLKDITIANNLITGSENALVAIIDDNDQGNNITWLNNLFQPTASATTISGATSTSFTSSMVVNENPNLEYDSVENIWRTTETTPNYQNAVTTEVIAKDIEGQDRPTTSNPGADHFSTESVRYSYLKPADVGPNAYEVDETSESLYVSSISEFEATEQTQEVTITANVDWSVTDDSDWISVSPEAGSNNGAFNITVTQNTVYTERTGIVTIVGGDLTRILNVTQKAKDPKTDLTLINDQSENDNVSVNYVFHEEITSSKNNVAVNSLDKKLDTQWSGNGVGGEIIYDLGGAFDLKLIDYATTNGKTYELEIWVSTTGVATEDFQNAFPTTGKLTSNSDGTYKSFILPDVATGAKYVKIIGYGQPSGSNWNTIVEIDFYKTSSLSLSNAAWVNDISIYPNPTNDFFNIKVSNTQLKLVQLFNVNGKKVLERNIDVKTTEVKLDVSKLTKGAYFIVLSDKSNKKVSQTILIK